jgi:formylglycine-generating enzyme required for sulfatase activity
LSRHIAQDIIEEYLDDANQARAFLNYVDQRAGLLTGRPSASGRPDTYTFPHRTFQEYLAGCYLLTGSDGERVERFCACAAEGDRWNLVAQLGAEELLYNNIRNGARELFYLADGLLEDELPTPQEQRAALWSGQMALLASGEWITRGARTPQRGQAYFRRLVPQMVTLLTSDLTAPERCQAGEVLGQFGDPRFQAEAWYLPNGPLLGFVEIPEGPFLMGSDQAHDPDAYDHEGPQHEVSLPQYFIGRYPVTVAQFQAFVKDSGYQPRAEGSLQGLANHPVVDVSWYDARKYCEWLTGQLRAWQLTPEPLAHLLRHERWQVMLPSEAEWEKAARGSDGRTYPWGDNPDPNRANYYDTGIYRASAVGCFPVGASPYGVHELSGNVFEWTRSLWQSLWAPYPYPTKKNGQAQRENLDAGRDVDRVLRGGAFGNSFQGVRCTYRTSVNPDLLGNNLGFRVVVRPCH